MFKLADSHSKVSKITNNLSKDIYLTICSIIEYTSICLVLIVVLSCLCACQLINASPETSYSKNTSVRASSSESQSTTNQVDYNAENTIKIQTHPDDLNWPESMPAPGSHSAEISLISPIYNQMHKIESVLTISKDRKAFLWDTRHDALKRRYLIPESSVIAFNRASMRLAVLNQDRVEIYSLISGHRESTLEKLISRITTMQFSPDGTSLVLGGADGNLYRWRIEISPGVGSIEEDKNFERYSGHPTSVGAVEYHPFGRVFFSADWKGGLSAWLGYDQDRFDGVYDSNIFGSRFFAEKANRNKANRGDKTSIDLLKVSPDGKILALALQNGSIELWSVRGFSRRGIITAHTGLIYDLEFDDSSENIATVSRDGQMKVWKIIETEATVDQAHKYDLELLFEKELPNGRSLAFLSSTLLWVGDTQGKIHKVKL